MVTSAATPPARPRIVILGCGFAGAYCAQALERKLRPEEAEIILIDRQNYFVFYPLLVEAGVGDIEPRHSVVSIRSFLKRERFIMAEATEIDLAAREVVCEQPALGTRRRIGYDHLVIALGSIASLPKVPGLREYGFPLKSLADAVLIRDRAIEMLELAAECEDPTRRASLLHFVIVGANFTGAEMAGALEDLLASAVKKYETISKEDIRITLIDRGDRILSALDRKLSQYAMDNLRKRAVHIRLRDSVTEIADRCAILQSGETLATETVIWAAGIAPPPLLGRIDVPKDERGYMLCDRDLRVRGMQNIWGIGDASVNTDASGNPYPATAQHAVREGAICADNIARVLHKRPTKLCNISSRGSLAALGRHTGVAEIMGFRISGFPAWWLWRTVYLLKMPGFGRKLRVLLEWNVALLSRRDHVQLGIRPASRIPNQHSQPREGSVVQSHQSAGRISHGPFEPSGQSASETPDGDSP